MEIKTTSEIEEFVEKNKNKFYDEKGDWTHFGDKTMNKKWIAIDNLIDELDIIWKKVSGDKTIHGEPNQISKTKVACLLGGLKNSLSKSTEPKGSKSNTH